MKGRQSQRGFALIESLSTIAFASLALTGGLLLSYASFARLWLKHAAYETSICLSTRELVSTCRSQFQGSTALALPIGKLDTLQLDRRHDRVETKLRWTLTNNISLAVDDSRSIPLLGPANLERPVRSR